MVEWGDGKMGRWLDINRLPYVEVARVDEG